MFVVFEGIDGSGKTTVSGRVAKALRKQGIAVEHFREGGEFASPLVNRLREFGKDPRNLAMEPLPELLFYLAREAQLADELVRPALARGSLVFADRYLQSFEVLATAGRGVDPARVKPIVEAVAGGLWPDLTIYLDADPHLARARRQVSKIAAQGDAPGAGGSRKGLAGLGTNHRVREGYLALAAADPDRWLVLDNRGAPLDVLIEAATAAVVALVKGGSSRAAVAAARARLGELPAPPSIPVPRTLPDARVALHRMVSGFVEREPAVAAYLIGGLADPEAYDLLDALAAEVPEVVASTLAGDGHERAWALRDRLAERAPAQIARTLDGLAVEGPRAELMREALADKAPRGVLGTLGRNDGEPAWRLRDRLAASMAEEVVRSVRWLDGERAWRVREDFLAARGGDAAMADPLVAAPVVSSLRGLAGERAWALRRLAADVVPTEVIGSLAGVGDDEAWAWRERFAARAGKLVFRTIDGDPSDRAFALRDRHVDTIKEALDSMTGLDGEVAWRIRDRVAERWPSTTVKSLGALGLSGRGRALAERLLAAHPTNPSLLKHAARLAIGQVAPLAP